MNIEIIKNNKPVKVKKNKLKQPHLIDVDFSALKQISGNKLLLDSTFQLLKKEYNG
jgi:hypothetical protein